MSVSKANLNVPKAEQNASAGVQSFRNPSRILEEYEVSERIGVFHGLSKTSAQTKSSVNCRVKLTKSRRNSRTSPFRNLIFRGNLASDQNADAVARRISLEGT